MKIVLVLWVFFWVGSSLEAKTLAGIDESKCKYFLSIGAIFQDEAPYLKEWIEFHRLVGVKHFYLYNNNSRDQYKEVLDPYVKKGIVELFEWPTAPDHFLPATQELVYNDCIEKCVGKTKWLAVIDVDEFMVPVDRSTVTDFLKSIEKCKKKGHREIAGVMMFWQIYGTSNCKAIPKNKLLVECLTKKAEVNFGWNHQVKSICKPHAVRRYAVHGAHYKPGFRAVTSSLQSHAGQTVQINRIRLNHYWTRDEDFFLNVKIPRREIFEGKKYTQEAIQDYYNTFNKVEDKIMDRFVPRLKKRML